MRKRRTGLRSSQIRRVIVVCLVLLLALGSGTGLVAADGEDNNGKECPGENPNQGYAHASDSGGANSLGGIAEAHEGTGCT